MSGEVEELRSGPRRVRVRPVHILAVLCVLALGGCGTGQREAEAAAAAGRFVTALEQSDAATACDLLTPRVREELSAGGSSGCEEALSSEQVPVSDVTEVAVWGDRAEARTDSGPLFLTELDAGWRVHAAGCRPRGADLPYLCVVGGS